MGLLPRSFGVGLGESVVHGLGAGTEVTPIAQSSMKGHEKKRKRGAVCFASAVVTRDKDMAYTLVVPVLCRRRIKSEGRQWAVCTGGTPADQRKFYGSVETDYYLVVCGCRSAD